MTEVEMPSGAVVEFPDAMSNAEIQAAIEKDILPRAARALHYIQNPVAEILFDRDELVNALSVSDAPEARFAVGQLKKGRNVEEIRREFQGVRGAAAIPEAYGRPALELGGMAAGGSLGSAGGLGGLVAGAGGGYAAGGGIADLLYGEGPESIPEGLTRAGKRAAQGAAFEAGGQLVGKALGSAGGAYAKRQAASKARQALSEKTGVALSPADVKGTKGLSLIESALEKNVISGGDVQRFRAEQLKSLTAYGQRQLDAMGGPLDALSAGRAAKEAGQEARAAWKEGARAAYRAIDDLLPAGATLKVSGLVTTTRKHLEEISSISSGKVQSALKKIVKEPVKTWKQAQADRAQLGSLWKEATRAGRDNEARIFNDLKAALDKDIENFSRKSGGAIQEQFELANQFFASGAKTFKEKAIRNALDTANPETLVRTFLKPNNVTDIEKLKAALTLKGMKPIKQAWLSELMAKGEGGAFSAQKFVTAFGKYDEATLRSFLTASEYRGLKNLSEISRLAKTAEKVAGNPSGTAQVAGTMGLGAAAITHPVETAIAAAGTKGFAKAYFKSPRFQKWLIRGIELKPGTPGAMEWLLKGAAIIETGRKESVQSKKGISTL